MEILLLYLALGGTSLVQHARAVAVSLEDEDSAAARRRVGDIVSRDTTRSDEVSIVRAAMESVLENSNASSLRHASIEAFEGRYGDAFGRVFT